MADATKAVIVVGGGLAGIAAAVGLAARGVKVTLLEARHALGGRASSFDDPESGELLDNCQHVLLGCCTNLIDLYKRLGVEKKIKSHRRVYFMNERGDRNDLFSLPLMPAPLHLGPAMALFSLLSTVERARVVRAMLAMARMGRSGREKLEHVSFGDWLKKYGQTDRLIAKFYDPIVISALNEETRKGSAKYAIQVFQEAMLAHRRGYVVGIPNCPLSELYARLPSDVDLRLNTRVEELIFSKEQLERAPDAGEMPLAGDEMWRVTGVRLRDGTELNADAVLLATNHHAVQRWMSDVDPNVLRRDGRFGGLEKLESVPILGAHLWFDRPIMREYSLALVAGPLQWLFRKDRTGSALHGVISAARGWADIPKEQALKAFEKQVHTLFPTKLQAKLVRGVIVIEKRATFSPQPGTDCLRPSQQPCAAGIQNLYLAGDYTQTGWPATMEGAVRSGYLAAEAFLTRAGKSNGRLLVPDLKLQWPARILGLNR